MAVGSMDVVVRAVCDEVAALDLMTAEATLFEATVICLAVIFSGDAPGAVMAKMGARPPVVAVARHLAALSAADVVAAHGHARLMLWPAHCALMPDTKFGAEFQAKMAQVADDDATRH